jgi:hypothetical protein
MLTGTTRRAVILDKRLTIILNYLISLGRVIDCKNIQVLVSVLQPCDSQRIKLRY